MKRKLFHFIGIILVLLTVTSCIDTPELKGISNFKIDDINKERIAFNVDVKMHNPNNKKISIRPSTFKLYLNDKFIGNAKLLKKYKMGKSITTLENVPVEIALEKDVFLSLIQLAIGGKITARIEGKLKASVSGLPHGKEINETKEIDLKDLGVNLGGFLGL
ncbi:MAG TPA: hypothetical protein VKX31_01130 [Brumimicrobium sp.]|nr:hypothetical protein [Brumimicrobium sp.]